jgi:regulator of cell morphogenesis and NO signaling
MYSQYTKPTKKPKELFFAYPQDFVILLQNKRFSMMDLKKEKINKDMKMSDIILNNHSLILILERFGIELGLQDKTIGTVCNENNISTEIFLTIANLHNNISYIPVVSFNYSDIKGIIQYLENSHQYYSDEAFPDIIKNIQLMSEYNKKPEMLMVEDFFNEYKKEVDQHFNYENETVFPYILNLFENKESVDSINDYSVTEYKEQHDDIEEKLDDLKKLLIQHLPQKNDCIIRRKILFTLFNLEQDLVVHAKIENDILIPLVEKMEIKNRK